MQRSIDMIFFRGVVVVFKMRWNGMEGMEWMVDSSEVCML